MSDSIKPLGKGSHLVAQGECLNSISEEHGFFWKTLWDLPENSDVKAGRKDPNVLLPGDQIFIPALREKAESRADGQKHRFRRKGVPSRLVMVFCHMGKPRANEKYCLIIDGQLLLRGTTDASGKIDVSIPNHAKKGELTLGEGENVEIQELLLGGIDPFNSISGAQARLKNLGYDVDPADGTLNPATRKALRKFQADQGLKPTDTPDAATFEKIKELHGC